MADEAGSNFRDWQHPWLRVNVLVRDMARLLRDPESRPIARVELIKAIAMREKLRRHASWN